TTSLPLVDVVSTFVASCHNNGSGDRSALCSGLHLRGGAVLDHHVGEGLGLISIGIGLVFGATTMDHHDGWAMVLVIASVVAFVLAAVVLVLPFIIGPRRVRVKG